MAETPKLAAEYLICCGCHGVAVVLGARVLSAVDSLELACVQGPAVYGYLLFCPGCACSWVALAQDPASWYAPGGSD